MLLAPAGAGSLDKLGKLYEHEGDFTKRTISPQDIRDMSGFLKRDKIAFEEYALQDAIITLKHAISMEKFNMTVKQIGVPLTLSSIGRNDVFKEWANIFKNIYRTRLQVIIWWVMLMNLKRPKVCFASRDIGAHMSLFYSQL